MTLFVDGANPFLPQTTLEAIQGRGGIQRNGLYSFFVKGEGLPGTYIPPTASFTESVVSTPCSNSDESVESITSATSVSDNTGKMKRKSADDGGRSSKRMKSRDVSRQFRREGWSSKTSANATEHKRMQAANGKRHLMIVGSLCSF
jgi:hypothetical protein